jgi:hypothetical protein
LQALAHNAHSTFLDMALGHRKMPPGKRTPTMAAAVVVV